MERLTAKQKEVFDTIVAHKGNISMAKIGKLCGGVSQQAINDRLKWMVAKGYLRVEGGRYLPTGEGLDKIIRDGGKTKHSFYESTDNWKKTLRPDGFSKKVEAEPKSE